MLKPDDVSPLRALRKNGAEQSKFVFNLTDNRRSVSTGGDVTISGKGEGTSGEGYEVAVAVMPVGDVGGQPDTSSERSGGYLPGHDDAIGCPWGQRRAVLLEQGEQAVKVATEALARQIAETAQRIGAVIAEQVVSSSPETFGLESVEVSFGVTLAAGVQALFTAQAESSAQVAITLSRRADHGSGH